nr:MAG TPA: Disulfide-rich peptide [Caudoviricetes sp.]
MAVGVRRCFLMFLNCGGGRARCHCWLTCSITFR